MAAPGTRVASLTKLAGIKAQIGYKRRLGQYSGKPSLAVGNTFDRQFDIAKADLFWIIDRTHIKTQEGIAYLIEFYSRRVIDWSLQGDENARARLD